MTADSTTPASRTQRSQTWVAIIMLTVVTLLTFANSAPDVLVFDDEAFAGTEAVKRLDYLGEAFTRDVWDISGSGGGLYRPLLMLDFELEIRLFGDWLRGYHLVNILLHLGTTLLMFGFLRFLLQRFHARPAAATLAALVAALAFAVHPIHTEVVNSVFNRSSMFVSLWSIAGLWWLLGRLDRNAAVAWLGLGVIYSVAILFKESALVLPGIAFAFVFLLYPGSLWQRIRRGLPVFWLLIPILLYFWVRALALNDAGSIDVLEESEGFNALFDTVQLADQQSWLAGIGLFGQGMRLLLWPWPLQLYHHFPGPVEIVVYCIAQLVIAAWAVVLWLRKRPALAIGLAFYYLALLPSIRLFSLDGIYPHIAERYLYYPSVGLAIALAFAACSLVARFSARAVAISTLLLVLLMAGVTWNRNHEWGSELYLYETEYQRGHRGGGVLRLLVSKHRTSGRLDRVIKICEDNAYHYADVPLFVNTCALSLVQLGRTAEAIAALQVPTRQDEAWLDARIMLAQLYLSSGERQKAADQFVEIVNGLDEPEEKLYYQGELLLHLYGRDRQRLLQAQALYRDALRINPGYRQARQRLDELDTILASMAGQ